MNISPPFFFVIILVIVHGLTDRPELWPLRRISKLEASLVVQASSLPSRSFANDYQYCSLIVGDGRYGIVDKPSLANYLFTN